MLEIKKVTPQEAAAFCLGDIKRDPVRFATLRTIHQAYHDSDRDAQGNNLFGTDRVVGAYVLAQIYHIHPIGCSSTIDAELEKKVYRPLGFEVVPSHSEKKGSPTLDFYEHLGREVTQQPQL